MNSELETLAGLVAFLLLVVFCLWLTRRSDPDDRAAGIQLGQISPEADAVQHQPDGPTPHLLASQCMTCRAILCVDGRWLPENLVPLPAFCRVSHGLCPRCERAAHAEINRLAPFANQPHPATTHFA